jgi:hypothetical protein
MATWTRKPQECEGDYHFSGLFLATKGATEKLSTQKVNYA